MAEPAVKVCLENGTPTSVVNELIISPASSLHFACPLISGMPSCNTNNSVITISSGTLECSDSNEAKSTACDKENLNCDIIEANSNSVSKFKDEVICLMPNACDEADKVTSDSQLIDQQPLKHVTNDKASNVDIIIIGANHVVQDEASNVSVMIGNDKASNGDVVMRNSKVVNVTSKELADCIILDETNDVSVTINSKISGQESEESADCVIFDKSQLPVESTELAVCDVCGKIMAVDAMVAHMAIHDPGPLEKNKSIERPCVCGTCGMVCEKGRQMTMHMRTHTSQRKHKCVICRKTFDELASLQLHIKQHAETLPFRCSSCKESFETANDLKQHMTEHVEKRAHMCLECGKTFTKKSILDSHMRTHSGVRPYHCDKCGRQFTQSGAMHQHRAKCKGL